MFYLFVANILASTGFANLPLSFGTTDPFLGLGIRMTLLVLTFAGVLASGVVKKRQRLEVGLRKHASSRLALFLGEEDG